MSFLGLDTSNYTTSVAVFDGYKGKNIGRLLDVPQGGLGLRQSDALFQHIKRLPELVRTLREQGELVRIEAVGASTKPREVEGSYMPCFLAGANLGQCLADALGVPFYACSHQQGHIAAAAWSAGHMELLDAPFLAWHLSGGTTELLYIEPDGGSVRCKKLGGTTDISAGQLIDRAGVWMGLGFPAGKALDELSGQAEGRPKAFPVKTNGLQFSLSGMENKVKEMTAQGVAAAQVAAFVLDTVADVLKRTTKEAQKQFPELPVLCSGGVASNGRIRQVLGNSCKALFAEPAYSTDNAMGVAVLTCRNRKEAQAL